MQASLHRVALGGVVVAIAGGCGGAEGAPPPEPPPPPPARGGQDPLAKLPPERSLHREPPSCCPRLLGGWTHSRIAAPGSEVTATLSAPGPDHPPPPVEVNADAAFRVRRVSAEGRPLATVRERVVRVGTVRDTHVPYLTVRLPDDAPAYYALELELLRGGRRLERYVSYAYVPPQEAAVAVSVDREVARPGESLKLTIDNRGPTHLAYGLAYRLERWQGRWKLVNREQAFALVLLGVGPGDRAEQEIRLPAELKPGRYRVTKQFTGRGTKRRMGAAVEFRVR